MESRQHGQHFSMEHGPVLMSGIPLPRPPVAGGFCRTRLKEKRSKAQRGDKFSEEPPQRRCGLESPPTFDVQRVKRGWWT